MRKITIACVLLIALAAVGGCAKDPQVWVTPYVPKRVQPAATNATTVPPGDCEPCTRAYEEAVAAR